MVDTPTVWKALHQVNQTDAGGQTDPAFVDIGMGRYVAVWTEAVGGPIGLSAGSDIVGQIFDAEGNPIGSEFQVNIAFSVDNEGDAALAMRPGGGFVMVYEDTGGAGTSIRAETYDVDGVRITAGAPVTIAVDPGADTISNPSIAMRPDGSYLVTYQRNNNAGDTDIVGRIVSAAGVVSGEFTIFSETDDSTAPQAATLSNGNYVVVFQDEFGGSTTDRDIRFSIVTPAGAVPVSGTTAFTFNDETEPDVAALSGGGFVAVWRDDDADGVGNPGIEARIYDNNGAQVKATFSVNTTTTGDQNEPSVTALPDGGFVVIWDDDNSNLLRGQRYDAAGNTVGNEFIAGSLASEQRPVAEVLGDGRFISGFEQFSENDDIHATIFDPRGTTILGTGQADVITSRIDGATVKGKGGKDILLGQDDRDNLKGGANKDILAGGLDKDKLWGNSGKDKFVFDSLLGGGNVDTIKDFKRKKDDIWLDEDFFPALGNKVGKGEFIRAKEAQDGNDYLVYNKPKGKLYYDADGSGGGDQVLFAKLGKDTNLKHKDFELIDDLML